MNLANNNIEDLPNEIWKNIPNADSCYFVSNMCRIKSVGKIETGLRRTIKRKDKLMSLNQDGSGYLCFCSATNKKPKTMRVHKCVAIAFIPNTLKKICVNHINGIKTDNRVENLEWVTHSENSKHSFEIGLQCNKGENHPTSKLTEKDVLEIRQKYKYKIYTSAMLAKEYGVSKGAIKDVIKRNTWNHI